MYTPLQTLIGLGTKVWLDSIDPAEVIKNRAWGVSGATSNPIIVSDLIKTGNFDEQLARFMSEKLDDEAISWRLTDFLVKKAQDVFLPAWQSSQADDGYVSFELDPLLEDPERNVPPAERTKRYIELGKKWSTGHQNRMIKVPNTDAGVAALEELVAAGVSVNVTLTFT
ncbi:MAG TPA: transaldolase family protein, partial [Gemmataceae bacterium]|nr:transaldolase family protein [Gemmataceae bacterium]